MTYPQQDGTGRYVSGLQSDASSDEQFRSGAQPYHQPWEVDNMVNNLRNAEGLAYIKALGGQNNPVVTGGINVGGGASFSLGWFGYTIFFLVACVVVGVFAFQNYERYEVPLNSYNTMPATAPGYKYIARIEGLFKLGTVFQKDQYGIVNWAKLKALRSQAKKPETFEQDLCTALHNPLPSGTPKDLLASWTINPNGYCVASDFDAIVGRAKVHNGWYAVISGAGAIGVLAVVGWLMLLTFRTSR